MLSALLLVLVSSMPAHAGLAAYTRILMADGQSWNIDQLKVGDQVIGTNGSRNRVIGIDRSLLAKGILYGWDGTEPFVTPGHPLLTVSGWKSFAPERSAALVPGLPVGQLRRGDTLITPKFALSHRYLSAIRIGFPRHHVYVYDLHLNGDHTYYANGFVVHNSEKNDKGDDGKQSSDGESSDHNDGEKSSGSGSSSDSGDKQAGANQGADSSHGGQESAGQQSGEQAGGTGGSAGGDHGQSGQSGNDGQESGGGQSETGGSQGDSGGANSGGGEGSNAGGNSGGDGDHGEYADEQAHQSEAAAGNNEAATIPGNPLDGTQQSGSGSISEDSGTGEIAVHVRRSSRFGSGADGLGGGDGRTIDLFLQLPQGTRELSKAEERALLQKHWQRGAQ